jgi:transposase
MMKGLVVFFFILCLIAAGAARADEPTQCR